MFNVIKKKLKLKVKGVSFNLCLIPASTFTMGSPENEDGRYDNETQHQVTITRPYYLMETEVTQELYEVIMGNNPAYFKGPQRPVETVSWYDATAFCEKLSHLTGKTFRLPTEAEWEYACRAGTTGARYGELDNIGWYYGNSWNKPYNETHNVRQKTANAWGLYDMLGNVWEWCGDWYGDYPVGGVDDPGGPASGSYRVLRGSSWYDIAGDCRSAVRGYDYPGSESYGHGFRACLPAEDK